MSEYQQVRKNVVRAAGFRQPRVPLREIVIGRSWAWAITYPDNATTAQSLRAANAIVSGPIENNIGGIDLTAANQKLIMQIERLALVIHPGSETGEILAQIMRNARMTHTPSGNNQTRVVALSQYVSNPFGPPAYSGAAAATTFTGPERPTLHDLAEEDGPLLVDNESDTFSTALSPAVNMAAAGGAPCTIYAEGAAWFKQDFSRTEWEVGSCGDVADDVTRKRLERARFASIRGFRDGRGVDAVLLERAATDYDDGVGHRLSTVNGRVVTQAIRIPRK